MTFYCFQSPSIEYRNSNEKNVLCNHGRHHLSEGFLIFMVNQLNLGSLNVVLPLGHIVEIVYFFLFCQSFQGISVCMPELYPHAFYASQRVQEPCKVKW